MEIDGNRLVREIAGLGLLFCFLFLAVSLISYHPQDPSFNHQSSALASVQNQAGLPGAYLSGLLVDLFGLGAWAIPFILLGVGLAGLSRRFKLAASRWLGLFLLWLCLLCILSAPWSSSHLSVAAINSGGCLGDILWSVCQRYLHFWGTVLVLSFIFLAGLQMSFCFSWSALGSILFSAGQRLGEVLIHFGAKMMDKLQKRVKKKAMSTDLEPENLPSEMGEAMDGFASQNRNRVDAKPGHDLEETAQGDQGSLLAQEVFFSGNKAKDSRPNRPKSRPKTKSKKGKYLQAHLPPVGILDQPQVQDSGVDDRKLEELAAKLVNCLEEFSVQGQVVNICPGPVVTRFEYRPAPGVKVSRIAGLHDDLALALKAMSVRIQAPIPGKDIVGIEIPNPIRKTVYFREIVESAEFQQAKARLPMALGQDVQGHPQVADLRTMPHLLVAGATGAGKSVCLNSIIISLLLKNTPEQMQLLLVDPKRIELAAYADLPHLVHPVVTEMELAKVALDWAVYEMDRRYEALARLGVRNIEDYNSKLNKADLDEEQIENLAPLPYLVLIIDELADLMLTVGKDAEGSIVRLAQLARAAGIHLLLATQRPSVDVVTGLIKANFPARIAFQVSSKHDSRTILDTGGAECLLGKGDMLFKSSAGLQKRIHGAYISDQEISGVIGFWKAKEVETKVLDFSDWQEVQQEGKTQDQDDLTLDDPLYPQAVEFVIAQGKASISMIQRHLRIGFNRAARFIEQMERDKLIGPPDGSKPRTVLRQE